MKWAEISIQTTHEATEAVANIFHDLGASGVVIEDPELINSYRRSGTWDYCDIPEVENTEVVTVKAYLPVDDFLSEKLKIFEERINELSVHNIDKGSGLINLREIKEEDWASSWKNYFHPQKVGERVVIKPSWEQYDNGNDEIIIEIDPGMAFGTGTHHTTVMCIQILEQIIKPGDRVFDVGTGSGILAVTAAKLGAEKVYAVDLDSVAVKVAQENAALNQATDSVDIKQGDLLSVVEGEADVIIANIVADVIIRMLDDVSVKLKKNGYLVASGIIVDRLSDVTDKVNKVGLLIERVIEQSGWVALVMRKGAA